MNFFSPAYSAGRKLDDSRRRALAFADRMTARAAGQYVSPEVPAVLPSRAARDYFAHQQQRDAERLRAIVEPELIKAWLDRPRVEPTPEQWSHYIAHCDAWLDRVKAFTSALASRPIADRTSADSPMLQEFSASQQVRNISAPAPPTSTSGNLAVARDRERTPENIARYRAIRSGNIGRRMQKAALAVGSVIAWRAAQLLMDCGSNRNLWTARDLHSEQNGGELFKGTGGLTRCNRKFCATCAADERRRARTRIRAALKPCRPARGERWRFITLTSPTLPTLDVLDVIRIFNRAWRILCNGPLWRPLVAAGAKGIEFTVSDVGFHVHIHALALSRWIPQETLKTEWTAAIQTAWAESGVDQAINTKDGKLIVDIRLVRPKRTHFESQIGVDDAVNEVCKYLTKSQSWDSIPNDRLVALAEVLRWPRMVEVLGEARTVAGEAGEPSLDTPRLSAEAGSETNSGGDAASAGDRVIKKQKNRAPPLLTLPLTMTAEQWLEKLIGRRSRQRSFRKAQLAEKYRFAEFTLLNGDTWTYADVLEQRRKGEAWRAAKRERHYDVIFNDGQHCPKCAARLVNYRCVACNITVETRLQWIT